MKLTVIVPDSTVSINNEARVVDVSTLDSNIRAVQWDGVTGHIEFNDLSPNETISDIEQFSNLVSAWNALTPLPLTPEQIALIEQENALIEAKQKKVADLASITVTTSSGKVFDGDEVAIARMTAAIIASDFMGITEAEWKLADNTVANVTVAEVKEALALSIQRVGEIVTV